MINYGLVQKFLKFLGFKVKKMYGRACIIILRAKLRGWREHKPDNLNFFKTMEEPFS